MKEPLKKYEAAFRTKEERDERRRNNQHTDQHLAPFLEPVPLSFKDYPAVAGNFGKEIVGSIGWHALASAYLGFTGILEPQIITGLPNVSPVKWFVAGIVGMLGVTAAVGEGFLLKDAAQKAVRETAYKKGERLQKLSTQLNPSK